jgi:hypothetical protein
MPPIKRACMEASRSGEEDKQLEFIAVRLFQVLRCGRATLIPPALSVLMHAFPSPHAGDVRSRHVCGPRREPQRGAGGAEEGGGGDQGQGGRGPPAGSNHH